MQIIPVIDMTATGVNITRLRKNAGMAAEDLQKVFGFTKPQAIYKWQQGGMQCPHWITLSYWLQCLG